MMRRLYLAATLAFLIAAAALWSASVWHASQPSAVPATRHTLAEVAKHDRAEDCWMAIDGLVYDFTAYLPDHPSAPEVIVPSCGTDASRAFATKNVGRAHSQRAHALLNQYLLGPLQP